MSSHEEKPQPDLTGVRYQTDEVTISTLVKSGIGLFIFFLMNVALASTGYYLFVYRETIPPSHIFTATPRKPEANVPVLQKDPVADIHTFRASEWESEHSYSHWKDAEGRDALRIPLDRAMEIVKQRGLTAAALKPQAAAADISKPVDGPAVAPAGSASAETVAPTNAPSVTTPENTGSNGAAAGAPASKPAP